MSTPNKTIFDKLAEKADELELQRKAEELVDAATKAAHQADGKYADKVAKARAQASKGVSKLAEQGTGATPGSAAPTPATSVPPC